MVPLRELFHSFIGCIKKIIPHYQPAYTGCRAESKLSPGRKIRFDRSHVHNTNSPWSLYTCRPATCCSHRKNINDTQAHLYRIHLHENRASGYSDPVRSSSPRPFLAHWLRYADTFLNCSHRSKHAHTERKLPLRPCRNKRDSALLAGSTITAAARSRTHAVRLSSFLGLHAFSVVLGTLIPSTYLNSYSSRPASSAGRRF